MTFSFSFCSSFPGRARVIFHFPDLREKRPRVHAPGAELVPGAHDARHFVVRDSPPQRGRVRF